MSRAFVDTSAIYALLVVSDRNHAKARDAFDRLRSRRAALSTTSYVLVETYALLARRVGVAAARTFRDDFQPLVEVTWVDQTLHDRGLDLMLAREQRDLSLVDAISFEAMRDLELEDAFAYDRHFEEEGFTLLA